MAFKNNIICIPTIYFIYENTYFDTVLNYALHILLGFFTIWLRKGNENSTPHHCNFDFSLVTRIFESEEYINKF